MMKLYIFLNPSISQSLKKEEGRVAPPPKKHLKPIFYFHKHKRLNQDTVERFVFLCISAAFFKTTFLTEFRAKVTS